MKCKCSLNNNYEIIGLCDINKFNERIKDFQDKSWTQITIPEKLKLPINKPPIKNITKVFFNIKLTSNKIIKTPTSEMPNIEGVKLTGKLLLVAGTMCQNIIYVSDTIRNSIHSVKFDIPFNTYIVVDKESNLGKDSFCVYPCVEDVFLTPLDERTISKSVTLFLFAHRIEAPVPVDPPVPGIRKLPNAYIFRSFNDEDMAKIEFDATNKKLIVTSTSRPYKSNLPFDLSNNNVVAFSFKLKDPTGAQDKVSASINENENANGFRDALNGFDYKDNDKITVLAKDASKLILTNFPDRGENYEVPNRREQNFEITPNIITPSVLPYKITVKSKNNQEVLSIQFNKENLKFIVSSTGIVPDPSSNDAYFTLIFKNSSGIKFLEGTLNSNEDGSNFKTAINNKSYLFINTSLIFMYKDKSKIEILNYPNDGDVYVPNVDLNIFSITNNRLLDNALSSKIKILDDNNEEVASIGISKGEPSISVVLSTGAIGTNTLLGNIPYVEFLNYQGSGYSIFAQILGKKNASDFASKFNRNISSAGPIRLFNKIPNRIIITSYKNQGEYRIGEEPEFFKSDGNSLVPHSLNYNKIRLKNNDDSSVLYIYFDKLGSSDIYIEPYSTGKVNRDTDSFTFKITDSSGRVKNNIQGSLNRGDTAENINIAQFPNGPNISRRFNFGDVLVLEYSDKSLVEIFDFPFTSAPYNPTGVSSQKFTINSNGLTPVTTVNKILKNAFIFKNLNGEEMARVEFNITEKKIIVTTRARFYGGGAEIVFRFTLRNSTGNKVSAIVRANENIQNFRDNLNNFDFEFSDEIVIFSKDASKVVLTNSPNTGDTYEVPNGTDQTFTITPNSIMLPIPSNLLPNKITVKSKNDEEVLSIQFNKITSKFIVSSTGVIPDPSSNDDYFTIIIPTYDGQLDLQYSLKSNEDGSKFKTAINNKGYVFTLILIYKDKSKIKISNYPNIGEAYIPNLDSNIFEITNTGLIDGALPNKIKILGNNDEEVSYIQIIAVAYGLLGVSSTGAIGTNNLLGNIPYVEFLHYNKNSYEIFSQILGRDNAFDFASKFRGKTIQYENPIRLFNKIPNRIIITDYKNQNEYRIGEEPEFFKSDKKVLLPYDLNYNKIRLKNRDNSSVLYIYFDKIDSTTIYIEPYSTGEVNKDMDSFTFKITNSSGIVKNNIQGSLNKGETANNINIAQNPNEPNISKEFNFGDILVLEYSDKSLVEIFDLSFTPNFYNPKGTSSQKFIINSNELTLAPNNILKTAFIFKNLNNEEMAKVEFDYTEKKLIATSTGKSYKTNNSNADAVVFSFELRDLSGPRISCGTRENENGDRFKTVLNGISFKDDDKIKVFSKDDSKLILTNFPKQGQNYVVPNGSDQTFEMTPDSIIPNILPNKITVRSKNNSEVLSIQFNKENNTLIVSSTGIGPDASSNGAYFTLILRDDSGRNLLEATINSNEDGSNFKSALNNKPYSINNYLILIYKDKSKIEISNYPNSGESYIPNADVNIFKITNNGLIENSLSHRIKILGDNNKEVSSIQFIKASNLLPIVTSTGVVGTNTLLETTPYVEFLHYSPSGTQIFSQILGKKNASDFVSKFENSNMTTGFPVRLFNKISNKIIITDYKGQDEYRIGEEPEFFELSANALDPHNLNYTKIRLKNIDNSSVLYIYFDKLDSTNVYIEPYSTGIENLDTDSFNFKITAPDGTQRDNIQGILNKGETADNIYIAQVPNLANISNNFSFGDILTLEYADKSLVEIFDFPFTSLPYNPIDPLSQKFLIAQDGLKAIGLSANVIIFKGYGNNVIATVKFNNSEKQLIVESTGTIAHHGFSNQEYFAFVLKDSNGNVKAEDSVQGQQNGDNFRDKLNEEEFEYGDIIFIRHKEADRAVITNYPKLGENSNPFFGDDSFKLAENGLEIGYNYLQNNITFSGLGNNLISIMRFNKDLKILSVGSTKTQAHIGFGNQEYFAFVLKDSNGVIKEEASVKGNDTAEGFRDALNYKPFDFGYFITLRYEERDRVAISNFPNIGQTFKPPNKIKDFKITENGFEDATAPTPPISLQKISSAINIRNINGDVMIKVEFDVKNKKLIVTSLGVMDNSRDSSFILCALILNSSRTKLKYSTNHSDFVEALNNKSFEFGDVLIIHYFNSKHIIIDNYPNEGAFYVPRSTLRFEYFRIESFGIVKLT